MSNQMGDRFAYIQRRRAHTPAGAAPAPDPEAIQPVPRTPGERCLSGEQPQHHKSFDVLELLDELVRAEMNGPWTRTVGVYHPSSLSPNTCRRALYYDRTAVLPRPQHDRAAQDIFDEGHGTHHTVQARLERHVGFSKEGSVSIEQLHVSGSTDGVFSVEDWLLEIKSIGDASFSTLVKPKIEHVWQLHPYMFGYDIPRAQLLYINRNTGAKRAFRIYFSREIWDAITRLIAEVDDHVARKEPPDRIDDRYTCRQCKFAYVCQPK